MEFSPGGTLNVQRLGQPRAEPEMAVILSTRVRGTLSLRELLPLLSFYGPAIEVLDSRWQNYQFSLPGVIADNTSAAGFAVGMTNAAKHPEEVRLWGVTLRKNGEVIETGAPAAVLGNPLLSVLDVVKGLEESGKWLEAGQVILTGGITASVPIQAGDNISMTFPTETLSFNAV